MIIIGVDFHPEFQQIAFVDTDTGELQEKRLAHREEAEQFYRTLVGAGLPVRVGMEASGHARWFERLMGELQVELWIGDAAEIRTKRVRKQKTDRQDAQLILKLMLKDDFPRIWVPSWENRDLRQLLWHRHRMVQARTRIMNQLQAVALNEGLRCKKRLWRTERPRLESFQLAPWASRRRHDLLELLDRLNPTIAELSQAVEQEVEKCPEAQRLATHPGVGPLTALAFVLIIGEAERFQCGKQVASYLGLVPMEDSSGNRRRLGHITHQPLEPAPMPTGLHSDTYALSLAHQSAVERFGFVWMMQSALIQLSGVGVNACDLLKLGVEIYSYNDHCSAPFSRACWLA